MKNLLKSLIQADTTCVNGEADAAEILRTYFTDCGIGSHVTCWDKTRANIVAHIKSSGAKSALLFVCHLDVVPPGEGAWKYPPFSAAEEDGKIYGRGAADMKGSISALVTAIEQIVKSGDELQGNIIFAAVAGEETDSCGIRRFVTEYKDNLPPSEGIIVP